MADLPETYKLETNNTITKDLTVYIGLVFDASLDGEFLEQKYHEFVSRWPVVGGKLVKKGLQLFTIFINWRDQLRLSVVFIHLCDSI